MAMTPPVPRSRAQSEAGGSVRSRRSDRSGYSDRSGSRRSIALSATSSATATDHMRVPPRNRIWYESGGRLPQAGRLAMVGLPGYTGYVPGKVSENVHGTTFAVANEHAHNTVDMISTGTLPRRVRPNPGPTAGHEIPGYMGFCPGRQSDNIIGQTQAKGAETAWLIKGHQTAERQARVACYRRGERPPTGTADYSGYRTHGGMPGIDARHSDYE